MGISIGLVGLGAFGSSFAPLFKNHPLVDRIALCDREPERVARFANDPDFRDKLKPGDIYGSFDEILLSDLDALVIMTQPWLHAEQAIRAMEHGKHVYSAVPVVRVPDVDEILGWCDRLIRTCEKTGMKYMLGETTVFRPQTMFCRKMAKEGKFGEFVYSEGEYIHPYDAPYADLRVVKTRRESSSSGKEWLKYKKRYKKEGILDSPMTYPTHSVSGPMSIMGAHALKVSAYGFISKNPDSYFEDFVFSNVTALFEMSNGTTMRICEYRDVAYPMGDIFENEIMRVFGTMGSFRENRWATKTKWRELSVEEMREPLPEEVIMALKGEDQDKYVYGGHGGSHVYLVHEFVEAIAGERQPLVNAWEAVRYMAAGVAAHKSALRNGDIVEVTDWGDAPG